MPARIRKIRHDENTRMKIKVAKILNMFQEHLDGTRNLSQTQIKCGEILLSKALPSLQSVEHSGEVTSIKVIRAPTVAETTQSWADQHAPHSMTEH